MDPEADPTPFLRGLYQFLPPDRVAHILASTGRPSARVRRIPAAAATRLVVALGLFADLPIPQVWRRRHPGTDVPDPVDSAFCHARQRLGIPPLRNLFDGVARPMATHQTVGANDRGWRLMGVDGTALDLPDTPDNARVFGRPGAARAAGAFPQLRLLALCALGTRATCGVAITPGRRSEHVMAGPLLDRRGPGMLLLWDRGFFGYPLAERVLRTGAHLLARGPAHAILTPTRRLDDGSYLAALYPSAGDRTADRRGWEVRVIEYTHDDPHRPGYGRRNRLLTDRLNPTDLPAAEGPVVSYQRWEQELAFDELKTHLNGRDVPLRSKTPGGVVQEVYGVLIAYHRIRRVIHDAAGVDPDRVSFAGTLRITWCRLPEAPGVSPKVWYRELLRRGTTAAIPTST